MQEASVRVCPCPICQGCDPHPAQLLHHRMNLLLSRLDEQQRRWYVASESLRIVPGGDVMLALITGLNVETIRRGREELEHDLQDRPADRIRLPGGGRPPVDKKTPPSKPT